MFAAVGAIVIGLLLLGTLAAASLVWMDGEVPPEE
jgi:hypothetical protein